MENTESKEVKDMNEKCDPFDNVTGDFSHPTCVGNPFYDQADDDAQAREDKKALTREVLRRQSKIGYDAE